jgi:transposase-like protein
MTLLTAVALDANDEILPLCWALVPIEDGDNWEWFLGHMREIFPEIWQTSWMMISDRDKGLLEAVSTVFPEVFHSHCCKHLAANVQKSFGLNCSN